MGNGTRATIRTVDPCRRQIDATTDDGRTIVLTRDYLGDVHAHVHQPDDPHVSLAARMAKTARLAEVAGLTSRTSSSTPA